MIYTRCARLAPRAAQEKRSTRPVHSFRKRGMSEVQSLAWRVHFQERKVTEKEGNSGSLHETGKQRQTLTPAGAVWVYPLIKIRDPTVLRDDVLVVVVMAMMMMDIWSIH